MFDIDSFESQSNQNLLNLLHYIQIEYIEYRMCGNEISTVQHPVANSAFYDKIRKQFPSGKVSIKDHKVTSGDIMLFSRLQTFNLTQLELVKCQITHTILEQLLKCDLSSLERLNLNDNKIGPIGCRSLASCQTLSNLRSLQLNNNKIKDQGVKALKQGKFTQLEDLSLNDNNLSGSGICQLSTFSDIAYLSVSGNELQDEDVPKILKINPEGFIFLGLSRNKLTDVCLVQLMKLNELQVLLVDRNKIQTDKSKLKIRNGNFVFI